MLTRRELMAAGTALASATLAPHAMAQVFPSKPIKLVIPFPPGGTADIQIRLTGLGQRNPSVPLPPATTH